MSQLVACRNHNGILVGTDSAATHFGPGGEPAAVSLDRLVQLSERAVVLAGGAAESVGMCRSLETFVRGERLVHVDEIYRAALPFLASEYERFMRKTCGLLPPDPIHYIYFVLGGVALENGGDPFRLYLIWTRKKLPLLDGEEITTAYTVPRRIGLELKLNELSRSNAPLGDALQVVRAGMDDLEQAGELGRPFRFASVDRSGVTVHS